MSSASELTSAIVAAQSAAVVVINEKAASDSRVIELTSALGDADQNLQIAVDALAELRAEFDAYKAAHPDTAPLPTSTPLLGRSSSSSDHGPLKTCDVVRTYRFGAADADLAESGATALFMSDESGVQTATALDSALRAFFGRHPDTLLWYMPDNEITAAQLTQQQADAHTAKLKAMRPVIDRYPNARLAINFTAYGVRQGRHNILQPCAPYLHGIISSCYNPGRDNSPPVWDAYASYLDPVLDAVRSWGVVAFGCGEFGNPVDPRDPAKRPAYAAGAVQFMQDGCDARGLEFVGACWWDNQKSGGPDNRLVNDNPRTAQAWKDALA